MLGIDKINDLNKYMPKEIFSFRLNEFFAPPIKKNIWTKEGLFI